MGRKRKAFPGGLGWGDSRRGGADEGLCSYRREAQGDKVGAADAL